MAWDGRYENTSESQRSLHEDAEDFEKTGKSRYETDKGGTVQEKGGRIDVYGPSNSPKGHSHDWYDSNTGKSGHHD